MSSIKIGFAVIGGLIAVTASASAQVRYNGFPKLGYSVVSPAPSISAGNLSVFDARAELKAGLPDVELRARQSPFSKGGINSRGI